MSSDGRAKDETSIRDDEVVAGRVATLESAVCRCKRVHFDYYSILRNEGSTREVEPYMLSLLDGPWYMTGRDVRREDLRQFRRSRIRDRILTVRLTNEHFEQRHGLDLKTDYEDIDPRGYAVRRAVVRFPPTVARWMEERPELDLIEERGDGSADYALYYTDPSWAARRVMLYLGAAVVVEPEELRQGVHQQAGSLFRMYEGG